MALNTINTILKYATTCPLQVETITVAVTTVTAGTLNVTVTAKDITGSAVTNGIATLPVPITAGWTATQVADAIKAKLNDKTLSNISNNYTINGTSPAIVLTRIYPSENDSTLLVSIPATLGINSATSTNTTAGGTFTKLTDIVSYPDLGSAPSKLDTTTLSDTMYKTSIFGIQETPDMTFECYYDEDVFSAISALTASNYFFQLELSTDGKFNWQGQVDVFVTGAGVDEVRKMNVVTSVSSPLIFNVIN